MDRITCLGAYVPVSVNTWRLSTRSYTFHWRTLLSRCPLDCDFRALVIAALKNNGKTTDTLYGPPRVTVVTILCTSRQLVTTQYRVRLLRSFVIYEEGEKSR